VRVTLRVGFAILRLDLSAFATVESPRKVFDQAINAEGFAQEANHSGRQRSLPDSLLRKAETKMIGVRLPCAIKRLCSSTPLRPASAHP
jgi:hypothetical protein